MRVIEGTAVAVFSTAAMHLQAYKEVILEHANMILFANPLFVLIMLSQQNFMKDLLG